MSIIEKPKDFWGGGASLSGVLSRTLGTSSGRAPWRPYGLCVDPTGRVIVTDNAAGRVYLIDREQRRTKVIKNAGDLRLGEPVSVTAAPDGSFYVADPELGLLLHYDSKGDFVDSIGPEELARPTGLAFDTSRGRLIVTCTSDHRVWILAPDGVPIMSFGTRGTGPGEFNYPTHAGVTRDGDILITDALNHRVQVFTPDGEFKGAFGEAGDGLGAFNRPKGLAADGRGHVFVVDALMSVMQVFDTTGTLLLAIGAPGSGDGEFSLPAGLYIDESDNIYVADTYNGRLQVFKAVGEEE